MRRALPFAILGGCLGVGVLPALAANQSVTIRDSSFTPSRVAVIPGESVTWSADNTLMQHNVHFDGELAPLGAPSTDFSGSKQFDAEGTYRYRCDVHPTFMTGTVYVNQTGTVPTPSPTPSPSPTSTSTPTPTSTSGGGGSTGGSGTGGGTTAPAPGTSGGTATPTVTAFRVRAVRRVFCTRRSATCRKPGVFLVVALGARDAVRVRGTLKRGARRVRAVSLRVEPGRHRIRLPGRPLRPGRYALSLRAGGLTRKVRFRVRAS
jgi:plastocyanin